MSHRVIWFDIPVADLERARQFYAAVLEVRFEEHIAGSPVAVMEHKEGEVSGCLFLTEGFDSTLATHTVVTRALANHDLSYRCLALEAGPLIAAVNEQFLSEISG